MITPLTSFLVWQVMYHPLEPNYLMSCADDGHFIMWDVITRKDLPPRKFSTSIEEEDTKASTLITNITSINGFDINVDLKTVACGTDDEALILRTGIL